MPQVRDGSERMMIKRVVTDVDGVLTDGKHYYTCEGKYSKAFAPHDADAIKIFRALGVEVTAITADKRGFGISKARARDLGLEIELVPERERLAWFKKNCDSHTTAFVGDGLWDSLVLREAKWSFAPSDAVPEARAAASCVLDCRGGAGVLLEVLRRTHSKFTNIRHDGTLVIDLERLSEKL